MRADSSVVVLIDLFLVILFGLLISIVPTSSRAEQVASVCRIQSETILLRSGEDIGRVKQVDFDDSKWRIGRYADVSPGEAVWIRCRLRLPSDKKGPFYILDIGRVADDDETFVNGQLVGASLAKSPPERWNYFLSRKYFVDLGSVDDASPLVVAVRARSVASSGSGLVDRDPRLANEWYGLELNIVDLFLGLFALILTSIFSVYRGKTNRGQELRFYFVGAGVLVAVLGFMNSFYLYRSFPGLGALWLKMHMIATVTTVFFLFRFSETLFELPRRSLPFLTTLIFALAPFFVPGWGLTPSAVRNVGYLFAVWGVPTVFYGIWIATMAVRKRGLKHDIFLWPFLFGATLLMALGGWDLFQLSLGHLPVSVPASGIGFLIAISMAALALVLKDSDSMIGALSSDISDWKMRHDSLAADAAVGDMLRQIAHDVRSPLTALRMAGPALDRLPEQQRLVIRSAVDRISDIAVDLLQKGRKLKEGKGDPVTIAAPELLLPLVDAIVSEKRSGIRERTELEILCDFGHGSYGIFVCVQSGELQRAISNLIDNSIDATQSKGFVRVESYREDEFAVIQVCDNGRGIAPHLIHRLGSKGFTYGKESGNGLGLWAAKQYVEKMRGTLSIQSQVMIGTVVTIRLPLVDAPAWFASQLMLNGAHRVVVLDDDESIHRLWRERFTSLDVDVVTFSLVSEFVSWSRSNRARLSSVDSTLFLLDQEYIGENECGLDLIERLEIANRAYLVTSHFDDVHVRERAEKLRVKIVPKPLAAFIPLQT